MTEFSSWEQQRALVVDSLDRMDGSIKDLTKELKEMREDYSLRIEAAKADFNRSVGQMSISIAMLQVKAGVWGLIGGVVVAIPVAVAIVEVMTRR